MTLATAPLKTFFGTSASNAEIFDPKVIFDAIGPNPHVYLVALQKTAATSRIWLAVSRSADPAGLRRPNDWCPYPINSKSSAPAAGFADFPGIAVGGSMVVVTTNQVTFTSEKFTHAEVRVLSKAALANNAYGCPPLGIVRKLRASMSDYDMNAMSLAPAQPVTSPTTSAGAQAPVYLVSANDEPSSAYRIWRISGPPNAPTRSSVAASGNFTFDLPPDSPQPGGGTTLNTGDAAIQQAGLGNTIWAAHTIRCNDPLGGSEESCVRAVRIDLGVQAGSGAPTATIGQEANIGEAGDFYSFPGIAVNQNGQTAVAFQASGATQRRSAWWTMKDAAETTFRPPNELTGGTCKRARARFGDYVGAQTDPDNTTFWFAGERATKLNGTCQWATQIGGVSP
jgi:hypothetical protein